MTLGRQFTQLPMLQKPSELRATLNAFGDTDEDFDEAAMRQEYGAHIHDPADQSASGGRTLYEQVRDEGVREPLDMVAGSHGPILEGGHHRFLAAEQLENEGREIYLPMTWRGR